jgi:hypothetical protein
LIQFITAQNLAWREYRNHYNMNGTVWDKNSID